MTVIRNLYFWQICNIWNHAWPCILTTFLNWGGNSECNVESLIMILLSSYHAYFIPSLSVSPTRLLWSSLTDTCSNNFVTSCVSVWPSILHLQKIIDNCWLHNLWMIHNTLITRLLYLFINLWISFSLFFQCPRYSSIFNFLALWFRSSKSTDTSFLFHI